MVASNVMVTAFPVVEPIVASRRSPPIRIGTAVVAAGPNGLPAPWTSTVALGAPAGRKDPSRPTKGTIGGTAFGSSRNVMITFLERTGRTATLSFLSDQAPRSFA